MSENMPAILPAVSDVRTNKAVGFVADILTNPRHSRWIAPLLILADAVLCIAIVLKVSCT